MRAIDSYERFKDFTVVPEPHYRQTIRLAQDIRIDGTKGSVVECGCWKGGMMAGIAYAMGPDREYILCDSFEGLPNPELTSDGTEAVEWFEKNGRMNNASVDDAREAMGLAGIENPTIVTGWFEDTLPTLNLPDGIALLRLDGDFYDSTYTSLNCLYPYLNPGGVVIIDDYYFLDGCAKAVHDYLSMVVDLKFNEILKIETSGNWRHGEGVAFIRKKKVP